MFTCPFCNDDDFDEVGLKNHLVSGHCEQYNCVMSLEEERLAHDCTCRLESVRPDMIDPPEVKRNQNCPVHGRDWDAVRDAAIDDKLTGDA